ncbi:MAG: histidine phosphatase family protein [Prevotella sp.]|nr:histidine phosphatase family protein [Prevotella sp.]
MTTLILVRHGETVDNVNHIMQGQTQGQLTAQGLLQAHRLAELLRSEPIDVFVSSDLKRSVDTCRVVAEAHGKDVVTTPLLRERDWGSFTGRYIPSLKGETWPDDIESLEVLKHRARRFMQYITDNYPGLTVLAVGHGIINKAIQAVYYDKPMNEIPRMENAEVRRLMIDS